MAEIWESPATNTPSLPAVNDAEPPMVSLANFSTTVFPDNMPYLNTPRSIEVCRSNGVSVADLTPQPMSAFSKLRSDLGDLTTPKEEITRQRWERGEISRRKLIRKLQKDRDRVLMLEGLGKAKKQSTASMSLLESAAPKSAEEVLMERERMYLEKVQKKTEKELKQLLVYEMKRASKEQQQQQREAKQQEQDQRRREQKEEKRRANGEKRFKMAEAIKARKEEEDEALRRTMARQFEENLRQTQMLEEEKQQQRAEANEKTRQRAIRAEEKKRATEAIFKKQQDDVIARDRVAQGRDAVRRQKVEDVNVERQRVYREKRSKAEMRIAEAKRIADEIVENKRVNYESKEMEAKARKELRDREKAEEIWQKKVMLEEEMQKRREQKAEVERKAEEHAEEIVRKEAEINRRLQARGLLKQPEDRMRKEDEEEKKAILASLESTKEIEAKKIKRALREEAIEINMERKMRAEEYKKEKIMAKMDEDKKKLVEIQKERDAIKLKREIAANDALKNRHHVAEMTKKVLGNKQTAELIAGGEQSIDDVSQMVCGMLGIGGGEKKEKKVIKAKKIKGKRKEGEEKGGSVAGTEATIKEDEEFRPGTAEETGDFAQTNTFSQSPFDTVNNRSSTGTGAFRETVDPYAEVEQVRRRQNAELLQILKEEQTAEEGRERTIREMTNGGVASSEMAAVKDRFSRERNEASNRMVRYIRVHEEVLAAALKSAKEQAEGEGGGGGGGQRQ
ncbi:hypothetical protein TeGR_g7529 [Tetraparma gracilis]|uniref:Trichohyalin-plectin-homology domain-containing protein n=1 Tax=Tetraparma gracilis TaxID=2962635 RepID=A0ABQ6MFH4_9STRA|nr:hypothetical protein TeGR_g7529 [Tetraparma gracilis]